MHLFDALAVAVLGIVAAVTAHHLPRLRPELGRLRPLRIRRPAGRVLCIRIARPARAVVGQSLHVRRRLRPPGGARRQGAAVHRVRDAPADGRGGRHARPVRHLADRPPHRWAARGVRGARVARRLPALLRPHVHEPEGFAVRGRDGDPAARSRTRVRAISARDDRDRHAGRRRFRAVVRITHHGRVRRGRGIGRARPGPGDRSARRGHPASRNARRAVRALARAGDAARLCGDGAGLALVGDRPAQSVCGRSNISRASSRSRGRSCSAAP